MKVISPSQYLVLAKSTGFLPIDVTWYLPNLSKSGYETFQKSRIPGAKFIDIEAVKDMSSSLPHMLPSAAEFSRQMTIHGIRKSDTLLVYDQVGNFSAPRAAWMFDIFGHPNVYLLDNFFEYVKKGLKIDTSAVSGDSASAENSEYGPSTVPHDVISFDEFYNIVKNPKECDKYDILDARPLGRYAGKDPEPRAGMPSGHAPGVKSVPSSEMLDPTSKTYLQPEKLREYFAAKGVTGNKPVIVTCGTGVSACVVKLGLELGGIAKKGIKVYDGSWSEYAIKADKKYIVEEN